MALVSTPGGQDPPDHVPDPQDPSQAGTPADPGPEVPPYGTPPGPGAPAPPGGEGPTIPLPGYGAPAYQPPGREPAGYPPPGTPGPVYGTPGYGPPGYPPPGPGVPGPAPYGYPPGGYVPDAPYGVDRFGRPYSEKSKIIAGVLQLVLGGVGAGRWYTGHYGIAIAQLLTCGGLGVWSLIDGILFLVNDNSTDAQGRPLRG